MQALIEILAGFIAVLAAAALSQFGLDLNAPHKAQHEVHRVHDCTDAPPGRILAASADHDGC